MPAISKYWVVCRSFAVRVVKRIDQALPFHRNLGRAVHDLGFRQTCGLENGRRDIDHVAEVRADFVLRFDALGPVGHHANAGAAEVRRHLFDPLKGRIEGHGPAGSHMRVGFGAAPFVHQREQILEFLGHAVEVGHLVEHAVHAALGAGPVVAGDVEDQRVVELANILERLNDPADFVVGMLHKSGKHFGLAREEPFLVGRELVPILDGGGLGREPGSSRHHAQFDLSRQRFLAQCVPAAVEFAFPLGDPILRHMMRGMHGAGRIVDEERLVGRHGLLELQPGDRLIRHVRVQDIVRIVGKLDLSDAVMQVRRPLVGFTADKPIELVEALMRRPAIKRAGHAGFPDGGLMPFAERAGAVAVEPEHLRQGGDAIRHLAGGAGKTGRQFGDEPHVAGVMIATGLEGDPGRRTERRGVKAVVAQPAFGQSIHRGRLQRTAEHFGGAEAEIVNQHDHHVGRAWRGLHLLPGRNGFHVLGVEFRECRLLRELDRQHGPVKAVRRLS